MVRFLLTFLCVSFAVSEHRYSRRLAKERTICGVATSIIFCGATSIEIKYYSLERA